MVRVSCCSLRSRQTTKKTPSLLLFSKSFGMKKGKARTSAELGTKLKQQWSRSQYIAFGFGRTYGDPSDTKEKLS